MPKPRVKIRPGVPVDPRGRPQGQLSGGNDSTVTIARSEPSFTNDPYTIRDSNALSSLITQTLGVDQTDANAYLNIWAKQFKARYGRWPTAAEMDDSLIIGAMGLVTQMPQAFSYGGNTYVTGPGPYPIQRDLGSENDPNDFILRQAMGKGDEYFKPDIQELTTDDLQSFLQGLGGRGGSGGGSRGPVLDKARIEEDVTNAYRFYLLDEPDDAGSVADKFISRFVSFARQGGSLDFNTWILDELRGTQRFATLYKRKPPEMSEADFINQYRGVANDFGLASSVTTPMIQSGMTSGADAVGFQERLTNSRPVMARGGTFGRKVANQIAQLGVLNR